MPRAPYHLPSVLRALAANGEMRQADLSRATGLKASTLMPAVAPGVRAGQVLERRESGAVFYRLAEGVQVDPAPDASPELGEFNAALWADGDLVLVGVELNADGRSVTLNPAQAHQLRRLLNGQGPQA